MSNANTTTAGGVSGTGLLGILFVGLKLCGVIDWSWWWVTAPFWGPVAIAFVILSACAIIALLIGLIPKRKHGNAK